MSILAWWIVPVVVALLAGAVMALRGRGPRFGSAFEEIEHFHTFLDALARQQDETAHRSRRSTA